MDENAVDALVEALVEGFGGGVCLVGENVGGVGGGIW